METLTHNLIVVGGGPAGACAAIRAVREGVRVLLLERGHFPRHKVCGEFVSAESLGLLGTLLNRTHASLLKDAITIPRARVFLDGRTLETGVTPAAASISRLDLDRALWDSAAEAGVDARQQVTVHAIRGDGPFQVTTSAGEFEAAAVINATGRWSNLSDTNEIPRQKWIGVKGHFAELSPLRSVDLYFFDGGYCGVQPVDLEDGASRHSRVNAAAMVRADVASTLNEVFEQHPQLLERSRHWKALNDPVTTSPLIFREPRPTDGNVLLAGDAAGFVDPFVGDGISLALRSGALAAESLVPVLKGNKTLREAVDRYTQAYRANLAPVFRASSAIRRLLRLPRSVRSPILFALDKTPAVTRYLVRKTR